MEALQEKVNYEPREKVYINSMGSVLFCNILFFSAVTCI